MAAASACGNPWDLFINTPNVTASVPTCTAAAPRASEVCSAPALSGRTAHTGRSERESTAQTCGAQSLPGIVTPPAPPLAARRRPGTALAPIPGSLRQRDPGLAGGGAGHAPYQTYVQVAWGDAWDSLAKTERLGAGRLFVRFLAPCVGSYFPLPTAGAPSAAARCHSPTARRSGLRDSRNKSCSKRNAGFCPALCCETRFYWGSVR